MGNPVSTLAEHWGRTPREVQRLPSEADETYRVRFDEGSAILKIARAEPAELEFEAATVRAALGADRALPLARSLADRRGADIASTSDGRWARLFELLPGIELAEIAADLPLIRAVGRVAGRLTAALAGFAHHVDSRPVTWDLRGLDRLAAAAMPIGDAAARSLVRAACDGFAALPALTALPAQVVHGDLNGGNILVSGGAVTGIIDFGDATRMPRAIDLGIALAYAAGYAQRGHPWSGPAALLAGYREHVGLLAEEVALLPVIVRARHAQRVLMAARRAAASGVGDQDRRADAAGPAASLAALFETEPADAPGAPPEWRMP